jgi:hypothetical protein
MSAAPKTHEGFFTGSLYRPGVPPGLYEEKVLQVNPRLVRLSTAAFIGLAERGPVNTPVAVHSIPAFRAAFGNAVSGMLLPQAVAAFLNNGGQCCIAVRALNFAGAKTARISLPGLSPDAAIAARNPGSWANRLKLQMQLKQRSLPLRLAAPGDAAWPEGGLLAPAHRAQPGVTLLLFGTPAPARITVRIVGVATPRRGVTAVTLDTPLTAGVTDNALLGGAQELLLRLSIMLDGVEVESWDDAGLDPAHPDFLPRLIGRRAASELLLPPRVSGGDEPDRGWGNEDDPPGSEYLRPSLALLNTTLTPTAELLAAPQGVQFDAATLLPPNTGSDAQLTTGRADFFKPTPPDLTDVAMGLNPFADRPAPLDALSTWDDANVTSPIALVSMPDLLQPDSPTAGPDADIVDDTVCFGPCQQAAAITAAAALPYPLLGYDLDDFQAAQLLLVQSSESIGGRIALLDLPPGLAAGDIIGWRRALASNRAALFAPWLRAASVDDPLGPAITLPPSAAVAGLVARAEQQVGVYASPANQVINGVFALAVDPGLPDPGFLHTERIDAIRLTEKGIQLMGSRTTSLDPDWTHLNVRRVVDWLMAQLALDLAWAPFEPNNARLWSSMTRTAQRRLNGLFNAGALAGATAAQSYFVHCDRSTMTQSDLDNGRAIMLVGVAPAVPAEFLVFRLVRLGGDNASVEAVP